MGFEEAFVFVVAGFVVSYYQRSRQGADRQSKIIFLWILTVALPSLGIICTTFNQTALPLIFVVTSFLLGTWIYSSNTNADNANNNFSDNLSDRAINLSPSEEKQLKNCFSPTIYHLKDLEYQPQEIYCRGNLRSQNPKYAYETINQNIQKIFGDRFLCYLQESPIENLGKGFGASSNDQNSINYCFYLIPNQIPNQNTAQLTPAKFSNKLYTEWIVSILSIICTAFTVLVVGAKIHRLEDLNINNLQTGIPYLVGVVSIFIARAIAKYYVAMKYIAEKNMLPLHAPIFLPCIGGFGVLSSINLDRQISKNPTNQRRILFDLSVIPAIAGLIISIILVILGNWLFLTPPTANSTFLPPSLMPNLDTFELKNSIFITLLQAIFSIGKVTLTTSQNPETLQILSPLTLAGWTGLALSALQLLPFDLLDGGNLAIAMFGHRQSVQIAKITRIVILAISLVVQPWLRIYSILLFLLPTPPPLILNESIEIDRNRDLLGIGLMAIALLIMLPMPRSFL